MLSIKYSGFLKLKNRFSLNKNALLNMRGANLAAANSIKTWTIKNMNSSGQLHEESSLKWAPLKPSTIARRRNKSNKPLLDTGRLRNSFEVFASNRYGKVESKAISPDTGEKYGAFHEFGTNKIPKRKMLPTIKQAKEIVLPIYKKYVDVSVK